MAHKHEKYNCGNTVSREDNTSNLFQIRQNGCYRMAKFQKYVFLHLFKLFLFITLALAQQVDSDNIFAVSKLSYASNHFQTSLTHHYPRERLSVFELFLKRL